jgi:hypothetical protein
MGWRNVVIADDLWPMIMPDLNLWFVAVLAVRGIIRDHQQSEKEKGRS